MKEKTFTFDVEKIANGYLIFHDGKKVYIEIPSGVNIWIENELREGMIHHIIENFPKGTTQRLEVVVGVSGKVIE